MVFIFASATKIWFFVELLLEKGPWDPKDLLAEANPSIYESSTKKMTGGETYGEDG